MATQVTELGPCKRKISVSIPPEEVKKAIQQAWASAQQQVNMKGFRPGKVPRHVLEKKYGNDVRNDVKHHLINDAYRRALDEHSLVPVESPNVDPDKMQLDPEQAFAFDIELEVQPKFELPAYRGVAVGAPPVNVTPEDVEREIEKLRDRHATLEEVTGGVVTKGDLVTVDLQIQVDGKTVHEHAGEEIDTRFDSIHGIAAEGASAAFSGQQVGAVVRVPCHLPPGFEEKEHAGKEAVLACTIQKVMRAVPAALDDDFAKKLGADDLASLRERMQKDYQRHLEGQRNRYVEERLFDELLTKVDFPVPEGLLERMTHDTVHRMEHQMTDGGMAAAEAKANAASHTERVKQEQARNLRVSFLVDRIAGKEKLTVNDEDLENAIRTLAYMHGRPPQEVADELVNARQIPALRAQILDGKVRKLLREAATISEIRPQADAT